MGSTTTTVPLSVATVPMENRAINGVECVLMAAVQTSNDLFVKVCFVCRLLFLYKKQYKNYYPWYLVSMYKNEWFLILQLYSVCKDSFYNSNCSAECGNCLKEEVCDKYSGICISGCQNNFRPPFCQGIKLITNNCIWFSNISF